MASTARYLFRGPGGWSMRETLEGRRLHGRWAAATSAPFRAHGSGHAGRTGFDPWLLPPPGRTGGLLHPLPHGGPNFLAFLSQGHHMGETWHGHETNRQMNSTMSCIQGEVPYSDGPGCLGAPIRVQGNRPCVRPDREVPGHRRRQGGPRLCTTPAQQGVGVSISGVLVLGRPPPSSDLHGTGNRHRAGPGLNL